MPTWTETEDILRPFREWLNHTADEIAALPEDRERLADDDGPLHGFGAADRAAEASAAEASVAEAGLLQLVEAFTAMRHELKLQTRGSRNLETTVDRALEGLSSASRTFHSVQAQERDAADRAAKPLLEALIGLDEALLRAYQAFQTAQQQLSDSAPEQLRQSLDTRFAELSWWRRLLSRGWHRTVTDAAADGLRRSVQKNIGGVVQGFELLRTRIAKELRDLGIHRMETVGEPVDPTRMTVVEIVRDANVAPETVVGILRPGYRRGPQILRYAEVRVAATQDFDTPPAVT